ncbi:MAG: hypothetical protein AAB738_03555 [Patescibacteria group bacterium]
MRIIPAINCLEMACVSHKFLEASKFLIEGDWIHIDVTDAKFTYNKTWGNPEELKKLLKAHPEFNFKIEAHLMVEEPEKVVGKWLEAGVKRVIVHLEAILDKKFRHPKMAPEEVIRDIFKQCSKFGAEVMLATNPETKLKESESYLEEFAAFQVLAVNPGLAGQKFLPTVLEKARFLRHHFPNAKIEVDGGVNLETARLAKEAGADILTAASYIFDSENSKEAYLELLHV